MRKILVIMALLFLMVSVLTTNAQQPSLLHEVQPGENLFRIGLRYGVSIQELMQINGITNPDLIFVGQVLIIQSSNSEIVFEAPPELIGIVAGYTPLLGSPEDNECNPRGTMAGYCINVDLYICGWMLARYNRHIISLEQVLPETCRPPIATQSQPETGLVCTQGSTNPLCN